ncbi:MAG: hypothetical protein H0T79_20245, partial [Deltaproteobacteria bacterium]|nr:hypothetical protein [Deltaproteobacteria bacterium]
LPPFDNLADFCAINLGTHPTLQTTTASAFCVGEQGEVLAADQLLDDGGFTTLRGAGGDLLPDAVEPNELLPIVVGARVGRQPITDEPYPVIIAVRRDIYTIRELIVLAPPPPFMPPGPPPPAVTPRVILGALPPLMAPLLEGSQRFEYVLDLRVVELDDDADSELLVTISVFEIDKTAIITFRAHVIRVDLSAVGGVVDAHGEDLFDQRGRDCVGVVPIDLGDVTPADRPTLPGLDLAVACREASDQSEHVYGLYRTATGLDGPFDLVPGGAIGGRLLAGDVTGDHLDDLVIIAGDGNDAYAIPLVQCPAHDLTACQSETAIPQGEK